MSGVVHAFTHPGKAIHHLVHNPASAIVPHHVRQSSVYRNVVRPIVKVGTGAAEGFALGGPVGAAIGAGASALGGGLTNNAFRPLPNLVGPAAAVIGAEGLGGALAAHGVGTSLLPQAPGTILGVSNPVAGIADAVTNFGGSTLAHLPGAIKAASNPANVILTGGSTSPQTTDQGFGVNVPGLGHLSAGDLLGIGGILTGAFSGPATQAGQPTEAQRQQAIQEALQQSHGDVAQQLTALASDPAVQEQLKVLDEAVTRQVRAEMENEFFKATSQFGNLSGSAAQQMQNRIAATLATRLAEARQRFLLGLLSAQQGERQTATGQLLGVPLPPPQPSVGQQIGGALADIGSILTKRGQPPARKPLQFMFA